MIALSANKLKCTPRSIESRKFFSSILELEVGSITAIVALNLVFADLDSVLFIVRLRNAIQGLELFAFVGVIFI